ncbi:MAG: hypothetical protein D6753_03275 [Planctomycetota bacterium]|nr:MAG: hypothetical protein D6753_03275 [Planctomycetota bacterium]
MTTIDDFESLFRHAEKPRFRYVPAQVSSVLVVTDLDQAGTDNFMPAVVEFLDAAGISSDPQWHRLTGTQFSSVRDVLDCVERIKPELVITYRNLHAPLADFPFSLGVYLDVLSQTIDCPILVVPSPHRKAELPPAPQRVLALTDHLTGDDRLTNMSVGMTAPGGRLILAHVEDQRTFARYMAAIEKIPGIDTDFARQTILDQLLTEPHEYIESVREQLAAAGVSIDIEEEIVLGRSVVDYKKIAEGRNAHLLILNAKDEDQLAMRGLTHSLCVELRDTPILLL